MQNAGIAALGLNWRYLAFDVHPDELQSAIEGARAMGFIGLNLTLPHKLPALRMVDDLDESAKSWEAVNTIRFEARNALGDWRPLVEFPEEIRGPVRSRGFNTDAEALSRALREDLGISLKGKSVMLLGAGGAGRVAGLKLASEGAAALFVINRTKDKAEQLAADIRRRHPRTEVVVDYPKNRVDLLINATSLGLHAGDPLPWEEKSFQLSRAEAVYDMVYRPAETPLLQAAKKAGCRTANGIGMLLFQGTKALELWSDKPAPVAMMRQALEENVYG